MAKVISFANHKGGVGKTTAVATIAGILAKRGKKVLLVDLDAQANLTKHLSQENFDVEGAQTIFTAFRDKELPIYTIEAPDSPSLDLVPSTIYMARLDAVLATVRTAREHVLKKLLKPYLGEYDYILIDCPPALGDVVVNAFTASDFVVVPMTTDVYSYYGIELLLASIDEVQENSNPDLKLAGLFYNRKDTRTNISKVIEATVGKMGLPIFKSSIRQDKNLREAPLTHQSAAYVAPEARAVLDYEALVDEIEAL